MKGTPHELELARTRLQAEALSQDQQEMARALDEMDRAARDSIRSIRSSP
jgi:hypothetical protein